MNALAINECASSQPGRGCRMGTTRGSRGVAAGPVTTDQPAQAGHLMVTGRLRSSRARRAAARKPLLLAGAFPPAVPVRPGV